MPTTQDLEEARLRWRQLADGEPGLAPIADFHSRWLAGMSSRAAPAVTLELGSEPAARAVRNGEPLLVAGGLEVDLSELEQELREIASILRETAKGEASRVARAIASAPVSFSDLLAAALRSDDAKIESEAFRLNVSASELKPMLELALQPALWAAAEQALALTEFRPWERGYCPVCGAWPLYAELVGAQRERHLRCGRCGTRWAWAILLCPYCGNDDHRALGSLQNEEERDYRRVDVCEQCRGYLKAIAAFTPVSAPQLAAEDAATVHLDLVARDRGYERPGRPPDSANAGVPRSVREPAPPHDLVEG